MIEYHDKEWGVPVHDDRTLFEFLVLEGAQAGLTWQTVLNKRENYRKAFDAFDPAKIARYNSQDVRAPQRSWNNTQPSQDRRDNHKRQTLPENMEGIRFLRQIRLEVCRGRPNPAQVQLAQPDSCDHQRVRDDEQGASRKRLQIRWPNHMLRVHAGGRNGERPHYELFQI